MARTETGLQINLRQQRPNPLAAQFECAGGEMLALVGPSGSGKSSLLRLIAGLSRPEHGKIVCGNQTWLDTAANLFVSPQDRHIGYVPQHYGLFPHLSACDNIKAGLLHLPMAEQTGIAKEWLNRVQLGGLDERRPHELSGGQQQRVAVARALARNPSVLLMDEPFSATDGVTREGLYLQLAQLKQQLSIPIVMVTHDLHEAAMLADRMALLLDGELLQTGTPQDVMAHPVNERAARQLGIRNFFDGQIEAHDEQRQVTWLCAGAYRLACVYRPELAVGSTVRWVIPHAGVRVRARFRDDLEDDHNRISVQVEEVLPLGDRVQLKASLQDLPSSLHTYLPQALARELGLTRGAPLSVILRQQMIHILPA